MNAAAKVFHWKIDTKVRRRIMVLATYCSYPLLALFGADARASAGVRMWLDLLAIGICGMLLFFCWAAMAHWTREYGFPGDTRADTSRDERQTAVRHRAFVQAYAALSGLVCVACLLRAVGGWAPGPELSPAICFGIIFLCATLPSAIVMWTELEETSDK